MGPGELQEMLDFEPFIPLRMTLSSGSVIELHQREGVNVGGLTMSIVDTGITGQPRLRLVSLPNIALVEPIMGGRAGVRSAEGGI